MQHLTLNISFIFDAYWLDRQSVCMYHSFLCNEVQLPTTINIVLTQWLMTNLIIRSQVRRGSHYNPTKSFKILKNFFVEIVFQIMNPIHHMNFYKIDEMWISYNSKLFLSQWNHKFIDIQLNNCNRDIIQEENKNRVSK
jgi:hypothetical protein